MAAVKEMPRVETVSSMSLEELREQLVRFRQGGTMRADERCRVERKMKEILSRLAKLGQKGGQFAQIRLSDEAKDLCQRVR